MEPRRPCATGLLKILCNVVSVSNSDSNRASAINKLPLESPPRHTGPIPGQPFAHEEHMSSFQETGANSKAPFTLKVHRGDGMALLAMNWRNGRAAARLRRLCHRVPRTWQREVLGDQESHRISRAAEEVFRSADRKHEGPDSEVPLGAFPQERREARQVHLPRDADVHGRRRRTGPGRGTDCVDRADARDASRASSTSLSRAATFRRRPSSANFAPDRDLSTLVPNAARRRSDVQGHAQESQRGARVDGFRSPLT